MEDPITSSYEFGPFKVIPAERQLLRQGEPATLPPKAFDLLVILLRRNGHVVKKHDLLQMVWPDAFVEENNLNQYISLLRKTLSNGADGEHYIETIRGYGFRFTADVRYMPDETSTMLVHKRTRTHLVVREETQERIMAGGAQEAVPSIQALGRAAAAGSRKLVFLGVSSATVLAAIVLVAFFLRGAREADQRAASPIIRSIAVLPFQSLDADRSDDYLGLGIADSLITRLGQIRQLSVRPTSAIKQYEAGARDPAQIGRQLSVDAVLDGRFHRSGDQIRVTVQLINVKDRGLVWTGQFDQQLTNLLAVQDSISDQAAQAMKLQLSAWERERLAIRSTTDPEAYNDYLKGRFFWNKRTVEGYNSGIGYFQQAINLDHDYAPAYAGLADCYSLLSEYNGASPGESFAAAKQAANSALEIDESLAEAHTSLAYVLVNYQWDWNGAEREFKRALDLNPNYATAHQWYAEYLMAMGRPDEAQAELERALVIDPLSLIINAEQGLPFFARHDYDHAIEHFRRAIDLDPNFLMGHVYLRIAYEFSGQPEKAFAEMLAVATLNGRSLPAIPAMKEAYGCCGLAGVWKREVAHVQAQRRETYFSPYVIAQGYARVGDKDNALSWLEQAYKERDRYMIFLGRERDSYFASIRSDPRLVDLLRRMGLPS
jgi:DNA-binding winged helix-turn-helix (wHTH) protein/TolB-like protein